MEIQQDQLENIAEKISFDLLTIFNKPSRLHELLRQVSSLMRRWSGCEAVGIRLKDGEDYPYFETRGFPEDFVRLENSLCDRRSDGEIVRDPVGRPILACMCGNVIEGRFDPKLTFFTEYGSFWTNNTTQLLASTTERERQSRTRNRCNGEGYESVALIPLRHGETKLGLLQFNDTRSNRFSEVDIALFERLAASLSMALLQKLSVKALEDTEDRLQLALEGAEAQCFEIDLRDRSYTIRDTWAKKLGYEPGELSPSLDTLKALLHPDDLKRNRDSLNHHFDSQASIFEAEYRIRRKDGTFAWFLTRGRLAVRDEAGRPGRMLGIAFDISARKQIEDSQRQVAAMWNATFNSMEEPLFVMDNGGVVLQCNQATEALFEKDREQICGDRCSKLVHDSSDPVEGCPFTAMLRSLKPESTTLRIDDRYFECKVDPIFSEKGEVQGAVHRLKDISEWKQSVEKLEINQYYLAKAQEIGAIGTWELDIGKSLLKWTDENYRIFGVPLGTPLSYETFLSCVHPEDREFVNREWNAAIDGKSYDIEHRLLVDGRTKWVREKADITRDEQGRGLQAIGVTQDITKRKQAEQERERLQQELLQAHKMESVGRLAGGVAHDFNNMLGVILGHAEIAFEEADQAERLHDHLTEIQKAARRSAELTRQLLAFARKQTVTPKVLNINDTVSGTLKMLMRLIGEDISLDWRPQVGVWPVKMDPTQIGQVLTNLCVNARDAIAGVGAITIQTKNVTLADKIGAAHPVFMPGDYILLTVTDTGCGMDEKTIEHLFEPFYTTKDLGEGTGLGLATVYGIVSQNNGFITVESAVGKGTVFEIYLPRSTLDETPSILKVENSPPVSVRETVLLVEDEDALLSLTAKMLESFGYTVLTAVSPGEAVQLAESYLGEIHLLLTDVVMPEMNGRDLARRIIALYPNIRRLFMSGYTANVIAERGILEHNVNFIQKPFRKRELFDKVSETLAGMLG